MDKKNENKQFNEILDIVYNDIKNIDSGKDFKRIKKINSNRSDSINPIQHAGFEGFKRAVMYPTLFEKFKGGDWDHKPIAKKVVDSYYHNIDKNSSGKPAAIFGNKILGDDEYIYDHDFWGNVSYGYVMKKAGYNDIETRGGAVGDDVIQWVKNLGKEPLDLKDEPMVQLGMKLYDKYGDKITKEDLRREIIENKDILRRYKNEELSDRRYRTTGGEDLDLIAKNYGITAKQLLEYNEDHGQGLKNLSQRQSFLSDIKPIIPTPTERFEMKQTPIPMDEDEIRDIMKTDAYTNKYNPNYEKTQRKVRKAFEDLYPNEKDKDFDEMEDRRKNPENYYVWRTVGDGKVRSSHESLDGQVFSWDNPPEAGEPGEDYGCRCTAEPYNPEDDEDMKKEEEVPKKSTKQEQQDDDGYEPEDEKEEAGNRRNQKIKLLTRVNLLDMVWKNL